MNFDINDIKTWKDRRDVNIGDVGYVSCDFTVLLSNKAALVTKATIKDIDDNDSRCFMAQPLGGKVIFNYGFFLPLNKVKEEPEESETNIEHSEYRPFVSKEEIYEYLGDDMLVGRSIYLRKRRNHSITKNLLIVSAAYKNHELFGLNDCSLGYLFDEYECKVNGKWLPFGVKK